MLGILLLVTTPGYQDIRMAPVLGILMLAGAYKTKTVRVALVLRILLLDTTPEMYRWY